MAITKDVIGASNLLKIDNLSGIKKPKIKLSHPKTSEMVVQAIKDLKERSGSSLQAIKKYISANYSADADKLAPFIKKYIKNAVTSGTLVQTKGTGAVGSFKLENKKKKKSEENSKSSISSANKNEKKNKGSSKSSTTVEKKKNKKIDSSEDSKTKSIKNKKTAVSKNVPSKAFKSPMKNSDKLPTEKPKFKKIVKSKTVKSNKIDL